MEKKSIDRLIINSPYEEPQRYWRYNRENRTFTLVEGERRPAGYVIASESSKSFDDPGVFVEIPLVNQMRPRVKAWRQEGYPGVTGITKTPAGTLGQSGRVRDTSVLFLPARSGGNHYLAGRGPCREKGRHRSAL
jgi:hypothetical protein